MKYDTTGWYNTPVKSISIQCQVELYLLIPLPKNFYLKIPAPPKKIANHCRYDQGGQKSGI